MRRETALCAGGYWLPSRAISTVCVSAVAGGWRCDAVADISWRRVEGPHFDLYDGSLLTLIGSRAIPPAKAEITVEARPCSERTGCNSPGLWGPAWGLVAPRVVMPLPRGSAALHSG